MKCPKCGSEKYHPEYADKGLSGAYWCYDCNYREYMNDFVSRQQRKIEELQEKLDFYEQIRIPDVDGENKRLLKDNVELEARLKDAEEILTKAEIGFDDIASGELGINVCRKSAAKERDAIHTYFERKGGEGWTPKKRRII